MGKEFSRGARVAEQIMREVAELLQLHVKDPRCRLVTVTEVELSPDYAHAKVFYSALGDAERLAEIERGLKSSAGFLRRELGRRIHIHTLPELHFVYDNAVERGDRLSRLIDEAVGRPHPDGD
ncbi:MAG: 30S ribosome-binding factor RbfA [Rhodocyclaceae bacterium]|nr:30S ribosome-binding factor RbfA [Rhodocyclaceae bacterium]MBX3666988.1 30S ribosome-binding factor RbfA [Rhodocyclaceae bacterium]